MNFCIPPFPIEKTNLIFRFYTDSESFLRLHHPKHVTQTSTKGVNYKINILIDIIYKVIILT